MPEPEQMRYDLYARQRIFLKLLDVQETIQDMNWSSMAMAISDWREIHFQRNNFYRLKNGTLRDENINIIVDWIESFHDEDVRKKLKPDSIFNEVGTVTRDYYFHIPADNVLEEWDEQILQEFSDVYLCAPEEDRNSFTPLPVLRRWFEDKESAPELEKKNRSLDIKQYISERSILILQRTLGGYFYAAEFPMSALFPRSFVTLDRRMIYEGVGIVSSNSILVQLRDCLARVPKTHSMVINQKTANHLNKPYGLKLFIPWEEHLIRKEWSKMKPSDHDHLRAEFALAIEADYYLQGATQITISPLPDVSYKLGLSIARGMVYHRKPSNFLRDIEAHFIRPDLGNVEEVEKIIANPLSIGGLL